MSAFIDQVDIEVHAGDGGRGAISFRHEAHVPRGGPDGGDGGRGGDVILRVDAELGTLSDFRFRHTYQATPGAPGSGKDRSGKSGGDLILRVPPGTIVVDSETSERVADLTTHGEELVLARGGRGGKGNARFTTSVRQAPRIAEDGTPGQRHRIRLELKLLADIGLAGLPNAGKSTLLGALTRARPKIAAYPFTTLTPNLGVALLDDRELVIADIPGLIEGAHDGIGLGEEFLRHLERTRLIVHVVDAAQENPLADIATIENELALHGGGLVDLPRLYALNKTDLPDAREAIPGLIEALAKNGREALPISAASGDGVPALLRRIFDRCAQRVVETPDRRPERRIAFQKSAKDFTVTKQGTAFIVTGPKVERLASGIDWGDPDAAAYFQRVILRSGVTEALRTSGVKDGDTVRIGKAELEWKDPTTAS